MKGFYDNILVKYANKFGKKYGSKVGVSRINTKKDYMSFEDYKGREGFLPDENPSWLREKYDKENKADTDVWTIPITPEMRIDAEGGLPLFSLSSKKKASVDQATEQLDKQMLEESGLHQGLRQDLGRMASYFLHPRQIASLHKDFTPVYLTAIDMNKFRDLTLHTLSQNLNRYNSSNGDSKKKINAVLELGRLTGQTFKPDSDGNIIVTNKDTDKAIFSKTSDEIKLHEDEAQAYLGVRKSMDDALDKYIETMIIEYGFDNMGVKNKDDVMKALSKATNEYQIRDLQQVLKIIRDIEQAKKSGYIPLKRWGEIGISVRSKDSDTELVHFEKVELPRFGRKKRIGENEVVQDAYNRLIEKYPKKDFTVKTFEMSGMQDVNNNIDLSELDALAASSDMSSDDYMTMRKALEEAKKKQGFKAHFFRANEVPGYSSDFERAINDYVISISGHLSRRTFAPKMENVVGDIADTKMKGLYEYAQKYREYVMDVREELAVIRQAGFSGTLLVISRQE